MRLNRLTDYAVVMLAHIGRPGRESGPEAGGRRVVTAAEMAADSGVPLPTVAKLMKLLAQAGILASQRGALGGYRLARAPERITMAEIIAALEGPIALTACVDGREGDCEVESLCPMRGNWDKVNRAVRQALDAVTLADMSLEPQRFPPVAAAAAARPVAQAS
ncbi:MAG: SUF system Fe-S cluster assembly regulator [Alphaproteobacteria bacterium]|nr:SUF system Fe-S cluster assembly regulator [Alphaproteobacteria bacterium]